MAVPFAAYMGEDAFGGQEFLFGEAKKLVAGESGRAPQLHLFKTEDDMRTTILNWKTSALKGTKAVMRDTLTPKFRDIYNTDERYCVYKECLAKVFLGNFRPKEQRPNKGFPNNRSSTKTRMEYMCDVQIKNIDIRDEAIAATVMFWRLENPSAKVLNANFDQYKSSYDDVLEIVKSVREDCQNHYIENYIFPQFHGFTPDHYGIFGGKIIDPNFTRKSSKKKRFVQLSHDEDEETEFEG